MRKNASLLCGVFLLLVIVIFVAVYPAIAPGYYNQTDPSRAFLPPFTPSFPLGTDLLGRDMLLNLAVAGRISLFSALLTLTMEMLIGVLLGFFAAYRGGLLDKLLGFGLDIFTSLQQMVTLIALSALLSDLTGSNSGKIFTVSLTTALIFWPSVARMIRGDVLQLKASPQFLAARAQGMAGLRLLSCVIMPNLMRTLTVLSITVFGEAIMMESTVSFLGLGISDPLQSLGTLLESARNLTDLTRHAYLWLPAALLMLLTLLSLQLISLGLQKRMEGES